MSYPLSIRTAMLADPTLLTKGEQYARRAYNDCESTPFDFETLEDASLRLEMQKDSPTIKAELYLLERAHRRHKTISTWVVALSALFVTVTWIALALAAWS